MTGIYVHVPFCVSKCPYCDFYSLPLSSVDADMRARYAAAVVREMERYDGVCADTLYFGGGTPSLLGGENLAAVIAAARKRFSLSDDAEVTLEANPADDLYETLAAFAAAGGNRLSLGMQASSADRLKTLGRRHTPRDVARTVADARRAGITNLSLDLMLAVPGQDAAAVAADVETCAALGVQHVSAYLLKIEEGTPFEKMRDTLSLPDDDAAAELYLTAVAALEKAGFAQYEISNFSKAGFESRHNLKYWTGEPYLGFGPAAHSFFGGKRFFYPRDLAAFMAGGGTVAEEDDALPAGSEEEFALLRLRLTAGLSVAAFKERFKKALPPAWIARARTLPPTLLRVTGAGIALTPAGFLISNTLIAHILNL